MNQENIIGKSKEAVFKYDVTAYRDELVRLKMDKKLKEQMGEIDERNFSPITLEQKKLLLPNFKDEYDNVLDILDGNLYKNTNLSQNTEYSIWLSDVNISEKPWDNSQANQFAINNNVITGFNDSNSFYSSNLVIPYGVESIDAYAFCTSEHAEDDRYNNISSVVIPNTVESIEDFAFAECWSLNSITLSNGLISIGDCAFGVTPLTTVVIPNTVESIGDGAFDSCASLSNITIPSSVTSIGFEAFANSAGYSDLPESRVFTVGSDEVKSLLLNCSSNIQESQINVDSSIN